MAVNAGALPSWEPILVGGQRAARVRTWATIAVAVLVTALAATLTWTTLEVVEYREAFAGRILPGATIDGTDVGGLTREEAIARAGAPWSALLERPVTVSFGERSWNTNRGGLGAVVDVEEQVDAALAAGSDRSWLQIARLRFQGDEVGVARTVTLRQPGEIATAWLAGIAGEVNRPAVDATLDASSGWVVATAEQQGLESLVEPTHQALMATLAAGEDEVPLGVVGVAPGVTRASFGQILLVRQRENRLYLYEGGEVTGDWDVTTGTAGYPTPVGEFQIGAKRHLPTWVNPDPDGWGANLPASIGPGPGNPLGLRALNWVDAEGNDDGIRFHGTEAISQLGQPGSHGCVRLANAEVVDLFDRVQEGARIISVRESADSPSTPPVAALAAG